MCGSCAYAYLHIVGIEIRPYWRLRIYSLNVHQIIFTAAVFLTRLPCASMNPVHMRASSSTSLNVRSASASASLLGCFEYDERRYDIGMTAFSAGVESLALASRLRFVDPHRLAAPHDLRYLLRTRFEEMELSVFLCLPCVCRNRWFQFLRQSRRRVVWSGEGDGGKCSCEALINDQEAGALMEIG
ncbi:hypothetical protein ARMSODRAFT_129832 [Armillaria solidipes]|uniref:Uncharacterized protein n=1 Tax=Armillaria solidipes TaxID=1076256 RepID=A0A2H3BH99_9AGAR|nr:hypothetical protein ARMSODRAFT_129832 [Armillaria solidipes]